MKKLALCVLVACGHDAPPPPVVIVTPPPPASVAPVATKPPDPPAPPPVEPFDLEHAKLVALGASPAKASAPKPIGAMPATPQKLKELSRTRDKTVEERFKRRNPPYDATRAMTFHEGGVVPDGSPEGIPARYQGKYAEYLATSGGKLMIGYGTIYGVRYLAITADRKVENVIDFFPASLGLKEETSSSDVLDVIYEDGILYACRGYNHPERSRKGYITAIDAKTGEMHWRSAAQTCGGTLVRFGEYIVTGYGEDVMPYQTHLLRKYDGATVQSFHNDGAMLEASVADGKLVMGTYKHRITYELR